MADRLIKKKDNMILEFVDKTNGKRCNVNDDQLWSWFKSGHKIYACVMGYNDYGWGYTNEIIGISREARIFVTASNDMYEF